MDRLLRASAPDVLTEELSGCIDAEQLAAWADGGLDASAARIVETHLASCASCQAMAAAFARVAPPAAVPSRGAWAWRWIVPIAATAAAAGLAIWVLAPRPSVEPAASVERTMAQNEIAPVTPPPAAPALEPAAPAASMPPARSMGKVVAPTATPRNRDASTSTPPPAASSGSLRQDVDRPVRQNAAEIRPEPPPPMPPAAELRQADAAGRTLRAEPPPRMRSAAASAPVVTPSAAPVAIEAPPAPPAAATRPQETVDVTATAPLIQAQSGERGFTVSTTQAENLPITRGSVTRLPANTAGTSVVAEFAVPNVMMNGVSAIDVGGAMVDTRAAAAATASRWRVLASGEVQRSATNDGPWQAVTIDPAVHITTGVAPLPSVCWLIGRSGVVLRTSDAQHFARVPFPETVDLVLIRTTNGASATVTAADGRMWTTTDEGKTWR
jgi:hypothetical protein